MNTCVAKSLMRVGCICVLAGVGLLAGGCGNGGKATVMRDAADFNNTLQSDKPVLMMFFKQGCASCAALEPTIDQLAGEYQGRADVAKLMVLLFTLTPPSDEVHAIKDKYDVVLVPVVILFVHGQQVARFDQDYNIDHYRKAINEALGANANPKK
jgi:thioredoxin 1